MEDLAHTHGFVCVNGEPCRIYHPGHHTHWIHRGVANRSAEFYEDALVRSSACHRVVVEFLDGRTRTYWNHEDLESLLPPGSPVSVHSKHHLLVAGILTLNLSATPDF